MMTSRAEYRLYLRQDNADVRLTSIDIKLVCNSGTFDRFMAKAVDRKEIKRLQETVLPANNEINESPRHGSTKIVTGIKLYDSKEA